MKRNSKSFPEQLSGVVRSSHPVAQELHLSACHHMATGFVDNWLYLHFLKCSKQILYSLAIKKYVSFTPFNFGACEIRKDIDMLVYGWENMKLHSIDVSILFLPGKHCE